uniref:Cytoplasmic dynein 2 light intermediate chain 1 n=1 Tax=Percolomonas cosmopolitus TaxID=63605 RepID=A0A7S1KMQ4_9EUKA
MPSTAQKPSNSKPGDSKTNRQNSHDIWRLIETKYNNASSSSTDNSELTASESKKQEVIETNILFVGSASSGKSSLLHKVLLRQSASAPVEPSIALEYTYGRKEDGYKLFIAHFWELAGGTSLASLTNEIINAQNIHTYALVLCLDLTNPQALLTDLFPLIHHIEKHANAAYDLMRAHNSKLPQKIMDRATKRFGHSHPDLDKVHFVAGIPLIIVANKYDKFQQMYSPQHLKVMAQTLRYLAHMHAATLIQMDLSNDAQHDNAQLQQHKAFRQIMNNIMFAGPLTNDLRAPHTDTTLGPVRVLAGTDSLKSIGPPSVRVSSQQHSSSGSASVLDSVLKNHPYIQQEYLQMFASVFNIAKSNVNSASNPLAPTQLNLSAYPEPQVDAMRTQKDEELQMLKTELRRTEQQARQKSKAHKNAT